MQMHIEPEDTRRDAVPNEAKASSNNPEPREAQASRLFAIENRQRNQTSAEDDCCGNEGSCPEYIWRRRERGRN